jgi:hypothetical protein
VSHPIRQLPGCGAHFAHSSPHGINAKLRLSQLICITATELVDE